jgi:ABC-type sugar transport system substrate-binding protein
MTNSKVLPGLFGILKSHGACPVKTRAEGFLKAFEKHGGCPSHHPKSWSLQSNDWMITEGLQKTTFLVNPPGRSISWRLIWKITLRT